MKAQLRMLGIHPELLGTKIMEDFIDRKRRPENLTVKERRQTLEAWDSRHYVPRNKLNQVDKVKPEKGLEGEEYEKRYVELICNHLQSI